MKKLLSGFLLAMFLLAATPGMAVATTQVASSSSSSLQALVEQIASLMKVVQQLQSQLESLQKRTVDYSIDQRIALVESMKLGSESEQVKVLQALLAADAELYPEGLVTGYYGPATEAAVKRFQKRHGIEALGIVGPKTLKKCNDELEKRGFRYEKEEKQKEKVKYEDKQKNITVKYEHKFCIPPGHAVAPGWKKKNGNVDYYLIPFCNENGTDTKDTTAPVVSSISVVTGTTTATITWTTNEHATSQVKYGVTSNYTNERNNDNQFVTSHSITLTGLVSSTTYHYQIRSKDAAGNKAESTDMTFTTNGVPVVNTPDTTAPTITTITVTGVSMTSATIGWTTNENADSQIEYGTSASLGSMTTLNGALSSSHSQTLTGLTASTTYHYRVRSKDAAGNLATSSIATFVTNQLPADTTAPVISAINVSGIGQNTATISWTTDEAADTQVGYGTTVSLGSTSTLDGAMVTSHTQTLTGLTASTTYYFHTRSKDAAGNLAISSSVTFTTLPVPPDTTAPVISALTASNVGSTTATVSWTTDEPSTSTVYYGITDPVILGSAISAENLALTTNHSLAITGLTASTTYYFKVGSVDAATNSVLSSQQMFATTN